jgi:hypothetical protein
MADHSAKNDVPNERDVTPTGSKFVADILDLLELRQPVLEGLCKSALSADQRRLRKHEATKKLRKSRTSTFELLTGGVEL